MIKILPLIWSTIFIGFLLHDQIVAQNPIPNPGFESWSGNTPIGWSAPTNIPLAGIEPVTKSPEAYSDSWAVRGFVLDFGGTPVPPVIYTGSISDPLIPVSSNHDVFSCFYKYFGVEGDMLFIEIVFSNLSIGGGGEGHAQISINNEQIFEKLEIPILYSDENPPGWQATHANITITIQPQEGQAPHPGTWFLIDHFTFDDLPVVTNVKEINNNIPFNFELEQNFPNPFNPTTNIKFSIPEESFVNLKVFNIQGEEVATLVNEELSAGNYNAEWKPENLPSGVYIYTLQMDQKIYSNKMMLLK